MTTPDNLSLPRLGLAVLDRLAAIRPDGRIVLVSSARPREGKSFVAQALARQFQGLTGGAVLLVDATLPGKPKGPAAGGFAALLATGELTEGGVRSSELPGLSLLVAGLAGADADQVLFQPGPVGRALQLLRSQYDLVVIDAPTLAQCGSLALQADATVLVIDAQRSARRRVHEALQASRLPQSQLAGVVINRQPAYLGRWFGG
jgi:Mrp family chromosome partitioning ATPase